MINGCLAEASDNPFFGLVLASIQELLIECRRRTLDRHGSALAHEHHAAILSAVAAGDDEGRPPQYAAAH